jgi:hypothetical protein
LISHTEVGTQSGEEEIWASGKNGKKEEEKTTSRGVISCVLKKYYSGEPIKEKETGGECGTYGGEERCERGFGEHT